MTKPPDPLPIGAVLAAIRDHGVHAYEHLVRQGHPGKRVRAKMLSLANRGYTEYGVAPHRCWLTEKGIALVGRNEC